MVAHFGMDQAIRRLAGRAFLNTSLFSLCGFDRSYAGEKGRYLEYSTASHYINVGDSLEELWRPKEELDQVGIAISGLSDPFVSQGLYLKDFDGHEVEIAVDDPAVNWTEYHFLV